MSNLVYRTMLGKQDVYRMIRDLTTMDFNCFLCISNNDSLKHEDKSLQVSYMSLGSHNSLDWMKTTIILEKNDDCIEKRFYCYEKIIVLCCENWLFQKLKGSESLLWKMCKAWDLLTVNGKSMKINQENTFHYLKVENVCQIFRTCISLLKAEELELLFKRTKSHVSQK